jgi:uncharacterized protein involved in exopolysaccharide biosynthesis/Mrp family chromosome partitioning ATPase
MRRAQDDQADLTALRAAGAAVRRHRRWAGGAILSVAALTLALYAAVPNRYVASGSVWLDNNFAASNGSVQANPELGRNTELRVLTSSDIAAQVVDTLGLARVRGVGQPADGEAVGVAEGRRRAIQAVLDGLDTQTNGSSYAVAVNYTSADPVLGTGILNQVLERYVAFRQSGGARARERELLREETERAHDEVIRAEAAISAVRSATSAPDEDESVRIREEIDALDVQVRSAEREERIARRSARSRDATSDLSREDAARLAALNEERAALAQRVGSVHPDVVALDRRIAELAPQGSQGDPRVQMRAARNRTAALREERARAEARLRTNDRALGRVKRLSSEAQAARNKYASLLERYRTLAAPLPAGQGGAYIISRASVPVRPDFPQGWAFFVGGTIAALLAATAVVLLREMLVGGFRTRRHVESKLGIPVIGMVPDLKRLRGEHGDAIADPIDYLFADARSPFSAAFRSIHAGLRLGSGSHSPRSVAVSSALPDEGKTTVSICLARSAAMAGLRVVLVDCDVRHPAASRALSAHIEEGLIEVLAGTVPLRQALLRDTPSGAWLLGHRSEGTGSDDLIGSDAMEQLIATLAREFDLIVLDTPPALALAEAREVAAMADSVLLVARWRKTPVEATRIALDQLSRAGANVTAAVLSQVVR